MNKNKTRKIWKGKKCVQDVTHGTSSRITERNANVHSIRGLWLIWININCVRTWLWDRHNFKRRRTRCSVNCFKNLQKNQKVHRKNPPSQTNRSYMPVASKDSIRKVKICIIMWLNNSYNNLMSCSRKEITINGNIY